MCWPDKTIETLQNYYGFAFRSPQLSLQFYDMLHQLLVIKCPIIVEMVQILGVGKKEALILLEIKQVSQWQFII